MRFGARGLLILAFAVALSSMAPAAAVNISDLEITHSKRTYLVAFDALIDAEPARTRELLSDYKQWRRLSDTLSEVQLMRTFPDGRQRIRLRFHSCILFFCKTIQHTKDVVIHSNGDIVTIVVPELSDFSSGWEHWRFRAEHNKTRLIYHAVLEPTFYVPPLIGPWILKSTLSRTLTVTANRLEAIAKPVTPKYAE